VQVSVRAETARDDATKKREKEHRWRWKLSRHFRQYQASASLKTVLAHHEFPLARRYYSGYYAVQLLSGVDVVLLFMNIGETIRNYRLQKGMSQGDIEKRTGLLRCYLSRVENGHTIPSLDTLAKIASAMELPLSQFFSDSGHSNGSKGLPQLSEDEVRFLSQIRRYSTSLNDSDRKLVLAMVKKMAASSAR
jgi:transcriptional regulator with XRE-family HTH domain